MILIGNKEVSIEESNILVTGVFCGENRENKREMTFKEIIVEDLTKLVKDMNPQIEEE